MNIIGDTTSRHTKLAPDSERACVVFPKDTMRYIREQAKVRRVTVSRIVREYVDVQIVREKTLATKALNH